MSAEQMEPLLTTAEAARFLGISPRTLRIWRCQGRGPHYVKMRGGAQARVFYEPAVIRGWISERKVQSADE